METMKEITANSPGSGDMALFRAAHALGPATAPGRDIIATTSEDGQLYFFDLGTEAEVAKPVLWDGPTPSLAVVPEGTHVLLISGDENVLYQYALPPAFAREALLYRSPVAIRHVCCSDKLIALATEDPEIKVLIRANTEQMILIPGHEHGIKSVALDPSGEFLCSSSEDGTIRVFHVDIEGLRATQKALFKVQYKDIRNEDAFCRVAWQPGPSSGLLAIPANEGIIELIDRATWRSQSRLLLPIGRSQAADVHVLNFSPNGLYLAAGTMKQEVFIWSVATKEVLRCFRMEYHILSIQWALADNALTVYTESGRVGFVKGAIPAGLTPPHQIGLGLPTTGAAAASSSAVLGTTLTPPALTNAASKDTSTAVQMATKKKTKTSSEFIDDEAMDDGDNGGDDDDDDEQEFDEKENGVEAIKKSFGFGTSSATEATVDLGLSKNDIVEDDEDDYAHPSYAAAAGSGPNRAFGISPYQTMQEPFQSGSVSDGSVSLLAWTPLGEIECIRGANRSENLVKVEFADKSRRGFKFGDNYLFSMAVLDEYGAFFGVPRRAREDWDDVPDQENGDIISSFIFYRPFESWASNSSWHLDLPEGEDAECIAAAKEFCAVATSLNCLRIYTTSGIPFALVRLPGRAVTMTARDSRLAIVYHDVFGRLEYQVLDIRIHAEAERVRVNAQGRLPLTPPPVDLFASHKENEMARQDVSQWSTLRWLGFDERGVLYTVDSFGCVQALAKSYDWNWFPIGCIGNALQKKPEERHSIFTLGIVNNSLLYFPLEKGMSGPKLRGKHRPVPLKFSLQTAAFPKTRFTSSSKKNDGPVVNELWQQVRLAAIDGHTYEDEDRRVQEQAEMDKSLILMMKAACTNDEPARVLDLAKCLHLEKSHQIAQKLSVHFGFRQLQTQLYDLYRDRFERLDVDATTQPTQTVTFRAHDEPAPLQPQPARPMPRLARLVKPAESLSSQNAEPENEAGVYSKPSSPRAKRDILGASSSPEKENTSASSRHANVHDAGPKKPPVERSVAPTNPFLKKAPAATASGAHTTGDKKRGGLERLAKFTSPPPAKRVRPWK